MENFNPTDIYDYESVVSEIDRILGPTGVRQIGYRLSHWKRIRQAIKAAIKIQSIYRGQQVRIDINDREFKRGLLEILKLDDLNQDVIEKIHNQGVSTKAKTIVDGGKRKSFKRRNRNKNRRRSKKRSKRSNRKK